MSGDECVESRRPCQRPCRQTGTRDKDANESLCTLQYDSSKQSAVKPAYCFGTLPSLILLASGTLHIWIWLQRDGGDTNVPGKLEGPGSPLRI